ncbi:hypothetical protein D1007_06386 [Hordeum vulgare]|nr:hypothetical protein D1007_06386 [Hordeum vulgare]
MGVDQDLTGIGPLVEVSATSIALHLRALFSGLLPQFSEFFNAVLAHYRIDALHLHPRYVLLLSSFSFLCEDFLGVPPSVSLFQHFFSPRLTAPDQRSGCATLRAMVGTAGGCINMKINHFVEGFRRQWVFVDAGQVSIPLLTPSSLAAPSPRWEHARLDDSRLSLVRGRLETLREAGVTVALVMREFLRRQIAPFNVTLARCGPFCPGEQEGEEAPSSSVWLPSFDRDGESGLGVPDYCVCEAPCHDANPPLDVEAARGRAATPPVSPAGNPAGEDVSKGPEPLVPLSALPDTAHDVKEPITLEGASSPLRIMPNPDQAGRASTSSQPLAVHTEYPKRRSMLLGQGWKAFARARSLEDGHILRFKLAEANMLFVKFYGRSRVRLGCCEEISSGAECPSSSDSDEENNGDSGALGTLGSRGARSVYDSSSTD